MEEIKFSIFKVCGALCMVGGCFHADIAGYSACVSIYAPRLYLLVCSQDYLSQRHGVIYCGDLFAVVSWAIL